MNKNILRLGYLILTCLAFLSICTGLVPDYLSHIKEKSRRGEAAWLNDPRILEQRKRVTPGSIYDRNGTVLAYTVTGEGEDGTKLRRYPLGESFAHITGYSSSRYGLAGLEAGMAPVLMGDEGFGSFNGFLARITGNKSQGNSLTLTVDAGLQQKAFSLLEGKRGAVVALEPETGNILAMASNPSFDPNKIDAAMDTLLKDAHSPLLNRATQGAYAPGSVFKLITLAAAIEKDPDIMQETYRCRGFITVDGFKLNCNRAHGQVDLKKALALSCNTTFASLGLKTGSRALVETAEAFSFNTGCDLPIDYYPGTLGKTSSMGKTELASTAIGQGSVTANPMQIALAASGIANEGIIMRPRMVEKITSPEGRIIKTIQPEEWLTATDPQTAGIIKDCMVEVVQSGTGSKAFIPGVNVAGKTGSAENEGREPHAWFVGFAPAENPQVVVAVIIENGGSGGAVAAPIAREIMHQVLFG